MTRWLENMSARVTGVLISH